MNSRKRLWVAKGAMLILASMLAGCASPDRIVKLEQRHTYLKKDVQRLAQTVKYQDQVIVRQRLQIARLEEKLKGVKFRVGPNVIQMLPDS